MEIRSPAHIIRVLDPGGLNDVRTSQLGELTHFHFRLSQ